MKFSTTWLASAGAAAILIVADPARATFQFSQPTPPAPQVPAAANKGDNPVSLVPGRPDVQSSPLFPRVTASADGLPLSNAVSMILPPTFKVVYADPAFGSRSVTFHGLGRPADEVLAEAVSSADLLYSLSGDVITIAQRDGASPPMTTSAGVTASTVTAGLATSQETVHDAPSVDTPVATKPQWTTTSHTSLRSLLDAWVTRANAEGCEKIDGGCYHMMPADPRDPPEPWVVEVTDSYTGDFLQALGWVRAGFWSTPRPDIEVTRNNVIILKELGASR